MGNNNKTIRDAESPMPAVELTVDKSNENNEELKKLKEKIKVELEDALKFTLERIEQEIRKIKRREGSLINRGIDEIKLNEEIKEKKAQIRKNLDGYGKIMLQFLKNDLWHPGRDSIIRTEARRMVSHSFLGIREINKILPRGDFSRRDYNNQKKPSIKLNKETMNKTKLPPISTEDASKEINQIDKKADSDSMRTEIDFDAEETEKKEVGQIGYEESETKSWQTKAKESESFTQEEKGSLIEFRTEMRRLGQEYANIRGDFEEKRKWYQKILGLGVEKNDEVIAARKKWQDALDKFSEASLKNIFEKVKNANSTEEREKVSGELEILVRQLKAEEALFVQNETQNRIEEKMEKRGWFSKNVIGKYSKMIDKFLKLPPKYRIPLSLAILGGGIYVAWAGLAGYSVATLGTASMSAFKFGRRMFGGGLSAKGAESLLARRQEKKNEKALDQNVERVFAVLNDQEKSLDQKFMLIKAEISGEKIGEHIIKLRQQETIRKILSRSFGSSITAFGIFMDIKQTLAQTAGAVKEAAKAGKNIITEGENKTAVISEKIPEKTETMGTIEIRKGNSLMGELRRFALSKKFEVITNDGNYNPNDSLVNDYYQNLKFHNRLPSGLEKFKDVQSMPKNVQQEFFKLCDRRMNDYYHGLKRTIIENMKNNPKYYKSLAPEMKKLADVINDYDDYRKLPTDLKKVVFADREAANWLLNKYKSLNVPKLKSINLVQDLNGRINFDETSGIKTDYLHKISQNTGTGRMATTENHGITRDGEGIDTSEFDQKIEEARRRGVAAEAQGKSEVARLGAEAQNLNAQAISGMTKANMRLLNMWMERGGVGKFKPETPAVKILESIKGLNPEVNSDVSILPPIEEMIQRKNVVQMAQEMFRRFPPLDARETMQQYMERMSRTNFYLFSALSIKNKL